MTALFSDSRAGLATLLIFLLPIAIIGIGEIEERLRQRDSSLQRPVSILRTWVVPLFAVWTLVGVSFEGDLAEAVNQLVASALVLATCAVALTALKVAIQAFVSRPRADGRRTVPRLVLAVPRLCVLLVTGWLLIAGVWNVDLSAALTALGVTSLIVSLALQDTLGGLASGFTLLADQPFQPGDWIRTGDVEGKVVDVNWRSSRIQTRDGDLVVVPNGQLATATITNFDEPSRLHRVVVPVQVAYANSPTRAKEMLVAAAAATPGVLEDPPPAAVVVQIDDPLMGYEVHMWIDDYSIVPRVRSDFGSLVWYHSHRFDVPLPSPAQDLFLWDGRNEAAAGVPDHGSLIRAVRTSPLLDVLPEDEIDRLAAAGRLARYAHGETIAIGSDDDFGVVCGGQAQLVIRRDGTDLSILGLQSGDLFGVLGSVDPDAVVVAATDCDVVRFDAAGASAVISRSPDLRDAIDQVVRSRQRRVQRVLRREQGEAAQLEIDVGNPDADGSDSGDGAAS